MAKKDFFVNVVPVVMSVANTISLCSAIITSIVIVVLAIYRRQALDRVTIRFQGLIALVDVIRHITMFSIHHPDGSICKFIAFFSFFLDHIYVFINVLITLNIQLIYLHNILPKPVFETLYLFGASVVAFVIDLIPIAYSAYGKNKNEICFLVDPHPYRFLFKVFLVYFTITPGLIYNVLVFSWVVISLYQRRNYIEEKFPSKNVTIFGESINGRKFIKKLLFRMALYPISSVVSFLPYLVSNLYHDVAGGSFSDEVVFLIDISYCSTGFMNLISLIIDPHFQIVAKNIFKNGISFNEQQLNIGLKDLGNLKREDEEYLIKFPGEESLRFEEYIKFL